MCPSLPPLNLVLSHVTRFEQGLYRPLPGALIVHLFIKAQVFKTLRLATWRAFAFWDVVAIITDGILLAAFVLRISSLASHGEKRDQFRLHSFQVLSCVAPFIW